MTESATRMLSCLGMLRARLNLFIGSVLIIAAGLKAYAEIWMPFGGQLFFETLDMNRLLVLGELVIGLFWLLQPNHRWLRLSSTVIFVGFSQYSLYLFLTGGSCNCFGHVNVPPLFTLTLDIVLIVASMAYSKPRHSEITQFQGGLELLLSIAVVAISLAAVYQFRPVPFSESSEAGGSHAILVTPEMWVGGEIPLHEYIENYDVTVTGVSNLIFHRSDCSVCVQLLKDLKLKDSLEYNIILVEVPPHSVSEQENTEFSSLSLSDSKNWFFETPAVMRVDGRRVLKVFNQAEIVRFDFLRRSD